MVTRFLICGILMSIFVVSGVWAQIAESKITASDAARDDNFGYRVSISGDYAIVGAWRTSPYIFKHIGNRWIQQVKLTASDGFENDHFGQAVSISGDFAIVGASGDDDNGTNSGSAYIFRRQGNNWIEQTKLVPDNGSAHDWFARTVFISGDQAIISAEGDDEKATDAGAAYIFKKLGNKWIQQSKLMASDGKDYHRFANGFANSISISGNYAIIGVSGDDVNGFSSGSAYIFKQHNRNWIEQAKLVPSDGAAVDLFGQTASIHGEYAIIGAEGDDDFGDRSGSAYVFRRQDNSWIEEIKLAPSDAYTWKTFGRSVAIFGDYAVVGAPELGPWGAGFGSAYLFKRQGSIWTEAAKLMASDPTGADQFGRIVSISDKHVIIGAPENDGNEYDTGSAYMYTGSNEVLTKSSTNMSSARIPNRTNLEPNYPNPFNPTTTIRYGLSNESWASLKIYNVAGQEIVTLVNEFQSKGRKSVHWNGLDQAGSPVASGIYLYRLQAGDVVLTRKMLLAQ